jgi:integrase/recombinase XerD
MRSVKPILWSRPTSDGQYQIKIRITENRKPTYINVGIKVKKGDWNENKDRVKTSHPNSEYFNNLIETFLSRYFGGEQLIKKDSIQGKGTLGLLFEMRIKDFESQSRMSAVRRYHTLLEHFKTLNFDKIQVKDLSIAHRQRLDSFFISELKIESSTRHTYHKAIKTTLNYAKGLPNSFQLPKDDIYFNHKVQYKPKIKVSLKSIEIHKMFDSTNYGFLTEKQAFAIHLFLFSFSTMGMRFKDVLLLKWGNIKSGYLTYVMSKNERDMRVKLNGNIVNILKYFLPSELYVNPFIKNKIEEPKFKHSLSIQIYKLESEFYFLKTQQMTLDSISSITSKKIKHSESPKVKKIIEKRDSLLIELIQQYAKTNDSYVFTNKFDDNLNYQQIYNRAGSLNAIINLDLKSVSKLFGIREFSFHSARHTFAYLSRQNKTDIYLISKCLGHSSLSITEQYLRTFEDQEVYDANDSMVPFINQFYK